MTNHKFLFHTIGHHQREFSFLVRYRIYTIYIYASEFNVLTKFIYNMSFYSLICSNTCQRKELADNQKNINLLIFIALKFYVYMYSIVLPILI